MDKSEVESYVKAGEIAKEVKVFARGFIERGAKLIDIAEAIDAKILELGGEFAFPVNLGLNEVAAHFTPAPGDESVAEGVLKIDIGVAIDGFIADSAFSLDLSEDGKYKEMIELNEDVLKGASDVVKVGMEVRDVGDAIQDVLESWNDSREDREQKIENRKSYAIIKSLSGHALGQDDIHAGLTISNYRNDNEASLDDSAFAIEPFVTSGVGDIFEGKGGGIYVLQSEGKVRDRDARTMLAYIKERYGGRPFCMRWLVREIKDKRLEIREGKIRFVLGLLVKQGILHEYPVLIEKSRAPVSQAENTFLIADGKVTQTT